MAERRYHRFPDKPLLRSKSGLKAPPCPGFAVEIHNKIDLLKVSDPSELTVHACPMTTLKGVCKRADCQQNIKNFTSPDEWKQHLDTYNIGDSNIQLAMIAIRRSAETLRNIMAVNMIQESRNQVIDAADTMRAMAAKVENVAMNDELIYNEFKVQAEKLVNAKNKFKESSIVKASIQYGGTTDSTLANALGYREETSKVEDVNNDESNKSIDAELELLQNRVEQLHIEKTDSEKQLEEQLAIIKKEKEVLSAEKDALVAIANETREKLIEARQKANDYHDSLMTEEEKPFPRLDSQQIPDDYLPENVEKRLVDEFDNQ